MEVLKKPDTVKCKVCGAELGSFNSDDIRKFWRVELDDSEYWDVYDTFEYDGVVCPFCTNKILFEKSRRKMR